MLKQSEIATIILVSALALGFSFFVANSIIKPGERKQDVTEVQLIDEGFADIGQDIFPDDDLNPTQKVEIGENDPDTPFRQTEN